MTFGGSIKFRGSVFTDVRLLSPIEGGVIHEGLGSQSVKEGSEELGRISDKGFESIESLIPSPIYEPRILPPSLGATKPNIPQLQPVEGEKGIASSRVICSNCGDTIRSGALESSADDRNRVDLEIRVE